MRKTQNTQKVRHSDFSDRQNFRFSEFSEYSGIKIGLHLSPHLTYIGERMQTFPSSVIPAKAGIRILDQVENDTGDGVIPVKRLVKLVNEIRPIVERIKKEKPSLTPSYFEILVAASFLYFAQEKVDFAVVEVGLGGRLDATNVLEQEVSVITNIGLDHTEILGNTIEKIAFEKAGIIKRVKESPLKADPAVAEKSKRVKVVTGAAGKALDVIKKVAKEKNAALITLDTQGNLKTPKSDIYGYITKPYYLLRSPGNSFGSQSKNLALLAVLTLLSLRGVERGSNLFPRHSELVSESKSASGSAVLDFARTVKFGEHVVKSAFSAGLPGRFEEIDNGVIIDGAHNVDKIKYLIKAVKIHTNYSNNQSEVVLVVAFKKGKAWKKMLDLLIKNLPIRKIIATEYQSVTDTGRGSSVDAGEIAGYLTSIVDHRSTIVEKSENSHEAVFEAINNSVIASGTKQSKEKIAVPLDSLGARNDRDLVLVTGSLYLVGEARTIWELPQF